MVTYGHKKTLNVVTSAINKFFKIYGLQFVDNALNASTIQVQLTCFTLRLLFNNQVFIKLN